MIKLTRRKLLAGTAASVFANRLRAARPTGPLVENTAHMFAADVERFPPYPLGTYNPRPMPIERYSEFVHQVGLDHTVTVHSEVYQDDHRYLLYCFEHEPSPGYLKGTCLFDPIDPRTPSRLEELTRQAPNRIVGMRIHEMNRRGTPWETSGSIRNRDLRSEGMKQTFHKISDLGLIAQMHIVPWHAPAVGELAREFKDLPVLIDHMAEHRRGTPEEFEGVLRLGGLPNLYMKVSGVRGEGKAIVRRAYEAFGVDRLIWGSYGSSAEAFERNLALVEELFDYAPEPDRVKIRGGTAMRLFRFTS